MTTDDGEGELRARVQEALATLPGPDRGRLATIEHGLPGRRRHRPWLVPLLLGAALAGAAAAGWYAVSRPNADDGPSHGAARLEDGRNPAADPGAPSGRDEEASEQSKRQESDDSASNSGDGAVIYQK